ncbi:MAG: DJ-1/PfpI family protein [Pseudomonadales bacterium]|nr:DJ-1/PfpI family protein [Pseudomonadales bacterium]
MNIGIYIYENSEVLDFSGPFEVFSTASRLSNSTDIFDVFLIAEEKRPVIARGGYSVNPHYNFSDHPKIDVLIVVGGIHTGELKKPSVLDWISSVEKGAQLVSSVCTGVFMLAEAGILSNHDVTTHWEDIDDLQKSYPNLNVVRSQRWVDEGKFVTSGGISAGIDMSLHLVSRLINSELAEKTAKQMEFDWSRRS